MQVTRMSALLLVFGACAGALDDPERFEKQFSGTACDDLEHTLLQPTCATAGCHTTTDSAGGLDLEAAGLPARLVGQRATGGAGVLIDSSAPSRSVLFTKTTSTPPFLYRMPFSATPLTPLEQQCLQKYVEAAATSSSLAAP